MNKRILEFLENWTAENIRETSGDIAVKVEAERMAILFLDHARMAGMTDIEIQAAPRYRSSSLYARGDRSVKKSARDSPSRNVSVGESVLGYPSVRKTRQVPQCGRAVMAICDTCGNDYDKAFQVTMNGKQHTFDSFECAIHAWTPTCEHCGMRIVGHGLENAGIFYCCDQCASKDGVSNLRDRD